MDQQEISQGVSLRLHSVWDKSNYVPNRAHAGGTLHKVHGRTAAQRSRSARFMRIVHQRTKNPRSGVYEVAEWILDFYGIGSHGVRFADGTTYNAKQVTLKVK